MNMKKHVLLVLLLGLTTSFCYSQVKVSVQGGAASMASQRIKIIKLTSDTVSVSVLACKEPVKQRTTK